jgi:hypothetical protein
MKKKRYNERMKKENKKIDMGPCALFWGNSKIGEINFMEIDRKENLIHLWFAQNKKSKLQPDTKTLRLKPIIAGLTSSKIKDWIEMPKMRMMKVSFRIWDETKGK